MTGIALDGLTKCYPGSPRPAVDGLSLEVRSGELTALLGPSGCGKTTALRMIAGLLEPTSGDIRFDGRSVLAEPPERRSAVMVFQNHMLFPAMTVARNVGFGLRMRGLPSADVARRVDAMLEAVQLPGVAKRRPRDLSGGQQQRVALARALVLEPKVLLLDEPLSNLDAHLRAEMRDLIQSLQRATGVTTVFVTHDREEAVALSDRIALMLDGRLKQHAPPRELYERPVDRETARFFGASNFIDGEVRGGHFHGPLGVLELQDGAADGPGILTIRPENVRLDGQPGSGGANRLNGQVAARRYLGTQTQLIVAVESVTLELLANPGDVDGIGPGDRVSVVLPPRALRVLRG